MYKLKLNFELENNVVENDLNIVFTSFLKQSLEKYDNLLFQRMFTGKEKKIRKYCFSVKTRPIKRENGKTILENNQFAVELTDLDFQELISFYNVFLLRFKERYRFSMNHNSFVISGIQFKPYKLDNLSDHVVIKMESPLIVRSYTDNGEKYLSIEDDGFEEALNRSVNRFLKDISLENKNVYVKPIKAKKTVMSLFRFKASATIGLFEIKGDVEAIVALCFSGIGNCRGAGAGMFKIIR